MDFVWKSYGNTYAVHVTVALVGVATLNLALPPPPPGQALLFKQALFIQNNIHNIYNNLILHTQLTKIYKVIKIYSMMKISLSTRKAEKNYPLKKNSLCTRKEKQNISIRFMVVKINSFWSSKTK